jgi:hypothetical protein
VHGENAGDGGALFRVTIPLAPGAPFAVPVAGEARAGRRVAVPS